MHISKNELEEMHRVRRLKLINGLSGIKPANLIGTRSAKTGTNVSIFSSVVHLGSNPALMGFIMRPAGDATRNTYDNIRETGYYTINHVHESFIEKAHYTSAKFESHISEFEQCGLTEEYKFEFPAPFVGESKIKFGLKLKEELPIKSNGTTLIVGEIQEIILPDESLDDKGYLRLDRMSNIGIEGLNSYYTLNRVRSFPYARVSETPDFKNGKS